MSAAIVQIRGGLGNQLFCYAMGVALRRKHGMCVKYDIATAYRDDVYKRSFVLDRAGIPGHYDATARSWTQLAIRLCMRFGRSRRLGGRMLIVEPSIYRYEPITILPNVRCIYMAGYWQSPRYFAGVEERVYDAMHPLVIQRPTDVECSTDEKVAIGVRSYREVRSDAHVRLSAEYYHSALELMRRRLPRARLVVFSDCNTYAAELLVGVKGLEFSEEVKSTEGVLAKLAAMANATAFIIGNSTFDWWAAWLGGYKEKRMVCAPRIGFPNVDCVCEHWHQL